jgi:hypothetical protein
MATSTGWTTGSVGAWNGTEPVVLAVSSGSLVVAVLPTSNLVPSCSY